MRLQLKPLDQQVIVITGASSGIGLLTAKTAAELGAKVILIARNEDAMKKAVDEITAAGGQATYAAADVADADAFRAAAEKGVGHFGGRVDTWVNDAGTGMFGKVTETNLEDDRRLFETNYWGVVIGSRLAVEYLRNTGGKLVNVGSVVSDASIPPQTMYSASKHAVLGFTDGLRIELMNARLPISVTLVKPAAIDTPFARHAKNYMANEPTLPSPVYDPALVASAILYAATHEKREIYVGTGGKLMSILPKGIPSVMDLIFSSKGMWNQQKTDRPARKRDGALHAPSDEDRAGGQTHGGIDRDRHVNKVSVYNSAVQHPILTGSLITAAVGAAAAVLFLGTRRELTWREKLEDRFEDYSDRLTSSARRLFS